jgi:hypothetical protein
MKNAISKRSITPGPRILIAIARTAISPVNALCELIDNSIDACTNAERSGHAVDNPYIKITIPSKQEILQGLGVLTIEDNGPGMASKTAINAVTAGYTGQQNPRDNLGLFGMGFNIATGKLGRKTVLKTSRKEDGSSCKITINLPELVNTSSFDVPLEEIDKRSPEYHGTIVEVSDWWPEGDPNYNFVIKLSTTNKSSLRDQLGRIYATKILSGFKIYINEIEVNPYYHCRWTDDRYVVGRDGERKPAYYAIDEVIGKELRCINCYEMAPTLLDTCPNCGKKNSFKEYKNRIYGWVGIQRFAHPTNYGIDLIRNGRLIRQWEKEPFFEWVNPENTDERVKDYPIDPGWFLGGRIIGEVHLDFVPVDFLKTNYQETSLAWSDSIKFLRGETSLQPTRAAGKNDSLIYKLYQSYRRIEGGPKYLYPGYWGVEKGQQKFKPFTADDAEELYEKFKNNEPGYGPGNDDKWFELVERAQERPLEGIIICPEDQTQNDENAEECINCGHLFRIKSCVKCGKDIGASKDICPLCGAEQNIPGEKWICGVCQTENADNLDTCSHCDADRGTLDSLSLAHLENHSQIVKELSKDNVSIRLPNGDYSSPFSLEVRKLNSGSEHLRRGNSRIPVFVEKTAEKITIVIDSEHPAFVKYQDRPEDYAAIEVANTIQQRSQTTLISKENLPFWSPTNIYYLVQSNLWPDQIESDPSDVADDVKSVFDDLASSLVVLLKGLGREIYNNLDQNSKKILAVEIANNTDIGRLDELIDNNLIFHYFTHEMILQLIRDYPANFFDGKYWKDSYLSFDMGDVDINEKVRKSILAKYINCLENLSIYLQLRDPKPDDTKRAELAALIVKEKISE